MPSDDYQDDPSTDHRKRDKSSSKCDKERRRSRRDDRDRSSKKSDHRKSSERRTERTEEREHRRSTDTKTIPQHKPACTLVDLKSEPMIDSDVKVIPMPPKRGRRRW